MRIILSLICLITTAIYAQPNIKSIEDIASAEKSRNSRFLASFTTEISAASNNFDVKYYQCEWQVDPSARYIKGIVTIYYTIVSATNTITLDLANALGVDSITTRGARLVFLHTGNALQISFPQSLPSGTLDSLSVYYKGIPADTGLGSFVQSTHENVPVIWTLSEPYGSRDWWPCKNGLDDKADSIDIFITHPSQYKAASNGLLQSEAMSGATTVTHWKHRYPIASYLVCLAVTNYSVFTDTIQLGASSLPMQTFCYPESLELFKANTPLVSDAMHLFGDVFGEYPFIREKYGHVQFGWPGGQEHQTATFIVRPDEGLMAHELAHQWFGDKITCATWQDIWLNEGFATHLASMYMEKKFPANILTARKNEIDNITSVTGGSVFVEDTTAVGRIFSSRLSYLKGSHVLYMLRWLLGDDVFFKGVRKYLEDPAIRYGFATTADLKRNLEEVSQKDLTKFFADWYYGEGYPSYKVAWSMAGNNYVKIKMSQEASHPSVGFFEMPVALLFKNATQQKIIVIDNKTNGAVSYQKIGFVADTVIIDPEYWLISKNNVSEKVNINTEAPYSVQLFPNPVQDRMAVFLQNFTAADAAIAIYNTSGQLIYRKKITFYNNSYYGEINTGSYARGLYVLKIISIGKTIVSRKIIK